MWVASFLKELIICFSQPLQQRLRRVQRHAQEAFSPQQGQQPLLVQEQQLQQQQE